ncbi:hypothetical protein L5515_015436 [Caenorhabditis briggsae]|uniref:Uncharacterized protein n=1 Tax=Caenorhabditis briggsae TaxID=6238 RepID=A0AAE9EFW4_CAEBR|nr:hypothetical protein L5515_015436 [Caenorhabditis briggsae]
MMARTSIVSGPTPEQTKEDLKAVIEQKDLQIVELKKQLNLSYLHVAELEESHRKAKVQGYKQGLAENSRLVSYFERKATKLMGRLIEYEDVKEDLFTGDIESDEEGVAARGSEEKQYASAAQWNFIKPIFSMVNAMKAKIGFGDVQEEEDQVTSARTASKRKFEELGDHALVRKMFKEK